MGTVRCRKERRKEPGLDMVVEADAGEEEKAELQRPRGRQPMDSLPRCPKRRRECDPLRSGSELARRGDLHLNTSHFKKSFCLHVPSSLLRALLTGGGRVESWFGCMTLGSPVAYLYDRPYRHTWPVIHAVHRDIHVYVAWPYDLGQPLSLSGLHLALTREARGEWSLRTFQAFQYLQVQVSFL